MLEHVIKRVSPQPLIFVLPAFGRGNEKLVYHRLPWKEPDAPYLLEILYEDDDVVYTVYLINGSYGCCGVRADIIHECTNFAY